MSEIYVIRHGTTDWSATKRLQGRADLPLNSRGRSQVAGWRLPQGWQGANCRCSPLIRARETAALLGLSATVDQRLIEMDWGLFEGKTLSALRGDPAHKMAEREAAGVDFRPPGGESPYEVTLRLQTLLDDVVSSSSNEIWVAHKGVRNACLVIALDWDMRSKPPIRLGNDQALALKTIPNQATLSCSTINLCRS